MEGMSLIPYGGKKSGKSRKAKGGLKKLPKKPKASASLQTMENWLRRAAEIKKQNDRIRADKKKKDALLQRIRSITNYL